MFNWLTRHLERIADSVVTPLVNWIISLRWSLRLVILILILLLAGAGFYHERTLSFASTAAEALRVWRGNPNRPSLQSNELASLRIAIDDLSQHLDSEFEKRTGEDPTYGSWTTADVVVAVAGKSTRVSSDKVSSFMTSQLAASGNCWKQFRNNNCHFATSAWVVLSLARVNKAATPEQLQFLLNGQKADGWWSVYEASDNPENASTYATAIVILALHEHLLNNLIDSTKKEFVQSAINRGRSWLLRTQVSGKARWSTYPLSPDTKESISLSGLVMHVLFHLEPVPDPSLARLWLTSLPEGVPKTTDFDIASHQIKITAQDWEPDNIGLYSLPWIIIASVDAYRFGSLTEKATALTWLDSFLSNIHERKRESYTSPWIAAEFEMSLRYLGGEDVI